jgi:hypothetical protein
MPARLRSARSDRSLRSVWSLQSGRFPRSDRSLRSVWSRRSLRSGRFLRSGRAGVLGLAVVVAAVALAGSLLAAACGGDDDSADDGGATSTTLATGGIEVAAPDGWTAIPLPVFGFGVAVPPGWEATRLDQEGLSSTGQAEPVVPGFLAAAHEAAQSGAVFYAAGVDDDGRVTDLKVRAILDSGVADLSGLETMATQLAAEAGLSAPTVTPVPDAPQPAVDVRYRAQAQRAAEDDPDTTEQVDVEGTERLVLSPSGAVYSLILTSEDAATHDDVAAQVLGTLAFPPAPPSSGGG